MKRALLLGFFLIFSCASLALASLKFPELTGRVVDDAHVLSATTVGALDRRLEAYENGTKTQVVVATLASLQGDEIADYGYQLGRKWGIGQKGKDNGVLLIVAPNEKKVRIEVGYGHEATLTDAASSQIINAIILPAFKKGDIDGGVSAGVDAILATLGGQSLASQPSDDISNTEVIIILVLVVIFCVRYPTLAWFIFSSLPSGSYRGGGGGGWSSGGFRGGGGSFGGGGASGSW